ncbi:hypothetical protein ACF05L_31665 [Streptomyces bobili]|uniref:hypothetical protein n=1 Tax=Streptomyces bobili TaxID=67280 RepID=UPI0036F7D2E2
MRSARMILATAAASAALALAAPGAYAAGGDWEHEDSSYSKERDNGSKHDAPRGGMHTGGGALTTATADDSDTARDPKHDPETYKKDSEQDKDSSWTKDGEQKESWSGEEKPRGGVHTGGGALASVKADDWGTARDPKHDPETYKKGSEQSKDSSWTKDGEQKESWSGEEKPRGGVHTGGGALDAPTASAGGLAVLAVAATGLYAARRKKSAHGLA